MYILQLSSNFQLKLRPFTSHCFTEVISLLNTLSSLTLAVLRYSILDCISSHLIFLVPFKSYSLYPILYSYKNLNTLSFSMKFLQKFSSCKYPVTRALQAMRHVLLDDISFSEILFCIRSLYIKEQ